MRSLNVIRSNELSSYVAESSLAAFEILSEQPTKLLLGLGIGNVSDSFLGKKYSGQYYKEYGNKSGTAISRWQWELGLIGTIIMIALFFLVLRDAMFLAKGGGLIAGFATGWIGVLAVLAISLIYNQAVMSEEIGFPLWYLSGYIVAYATKLRCEGANLLPATTVTTT